MIIHPTEIVAIERVRPFDDNPFRHSKAQITALMKLMAAGQDQDLVVDADYVLVKGHGRLEAMRRLGATHVRVCVRHDLTEAETLAHRLGDNLLADLRTPDFSLIPAQLDFIEHAGVDLALTGISMWQVDDEPLEPREKCAACGKVKHRRRRS